MPGRAQCVALTSCLSAPNPGRLSTRKLEPLRSRSAHLASSPAGGAGHEAALGAAVIAARLTGGPMAGLVQHLGLREVRERALDWLAPLPTA